MTDWLVLVALMALPALSFRLVWWLGRRQGRTVQFVPAASGVAWLLTLPPVLWTMHRALPERACGAENVPCLAAGVFLSFLTVHLVMFAAMHGADRELRRTDWSLTENLLFRLRGLLLDYLPLVLLLCASLIWVSMARRLEIGESVLKWTLWGLGPAVLLIVFSLYPQLIRVAFGARRLTAGAHHDAILRTIHKAGIPVQDVLILPGRRGRIANAWVSGTLPFNRRIFLSGFLLQTCTPEEVAAIVAHELGHLSHRHLQRYLALAIISTILWVAVFQVLSRLVPPTLGTVTITGMLLGLCSSLIYGALSRTAELEADLYAVKLTGDPEALIQALGKLEMPLSRARDENVPEWMRVLASHPTLSERVERLRRFSMGS